MAVPIPQLTGGVFVRYVDASNYFRVVIDPSDVTTNGIFYMSGAVIKKLAGTDSYLSTVFIPLVRGTNMTVIGVAYSSGRWYAEFSDGVSTWELSGTDSDLATGGALASGRIGLWDNQPGATASTRSYDDFQAWIPPTDAALFASQSLQIREDSVIREDAGGTIWTRPSDYEGEYLTLKPTRKGDQATRLIVKGSRSAPGDGPDHAIDDIALKLDYTPRYPITPDGA